MNNAEIFNIVSLLLGLLSLFLGIFTLIYELRKKKKKDRKKDISYIKEKLPQVVFKKFENIGHAGLALLKPETMALELKELLNQGGEESVAF